MGKSTLTMDLARALNFEPILEEVDGNPYLEKFYGDMKGYGTMMQVWLLNHRFRQHREFVTRISLGKIRGVVQDRTIWEDTIFARMLNEHPEKIISDLDYNTYLDLFDNMVLRELVFPQLLIYLDCKPETAIERINRRGRVMEQTISLEYLRMLKSNYDQFVVEMQEAGVRILRLNWESFPPISEVVRLVHEYSLKPSSFTKWVRPLRRPPELRPQGGAPDAAAPAAEDRAIGTGAQPDTTHAQRVAA
ncbi:MAG: deoxynucleoside kinase [Elusimicrobia bacterium]|nr:deoxynucleoside kinase [Elusimicrobiota bacterium]